MLTGDNWTTARAVAKRLASMTLRLKCCLIRKVRSLLDTKRKGVS